MTTAGGRYFGFVIGGAGPAALAANWLAGAWDQNADLSVTSPVAAKIEEIALSWIVELLELPSTCDPGFVTGTTMANFSALAAAPAVLLQRAGWNAEEEGIFVAPPIQVVVGEEVHVPLLKALSMLGFGRSRVFRVPTDHEGGMKFEELPQLDKRTAVSVQLGNVNSGAFDPVKDSSVHRQRRRGRGCTWMAPLDCGRQHLRVSGTCWKAMLPRIPGPLAVASG
jgi:glutamate/tyrosine decarboxylase-like PLP-dependent enzyme